MIRSKLNWIFRNAAGLLALGLSACSSGLNQEPSEAINSTIVGTGPVTADGTEASIITITLKDADLVPLQGVVPTFTATDTERRNSYGPCAPSDVNGVSTCTLRSEKKEVKQLSILSPVNLNGGTVTFIPGPIDHFAITTPPPVTAVAGQVFSNSFVLEARDEFDNLVTAVAPNITLTPYQNSTCTIPAVGTLGIAQNPVVPSVGVITFSGLSFTKTGSLYLKISSPGATPTCSPAIEITHAAAVGIFLKISPSTSAVAGASLTQQPQIETRDQYGNTVTTGSNSTQTITAAAFTNPACTTPSATILSATANPLTSTAGTASFSGLNVTLASTTYLRFSTPGFSSLCSAAISVVPNAASAVTSTISGTGPIAANGFHTLPVTIQIRDLYLNAIAGTIPTFSATNTGAGNTYTACSSSNASGTSTCTMRSTVSESKTLQLQTPTSVSGSVISFIPPPATGQSTFTVSGPTIANNVNLATVSITFLDSGSNPVVGLTPVLAVTGTGNTTVACGVTNGSGQSSCSIRSTKAEAKTLSLTNPLVWAGPIATFVHGPATKVVFNTQPSASVVAGVSIATAPVIEIQDVFSNRVDTGGSSTANITLSPFSDSICTLAGTGTLSAASNPLAATTGRSNFSAVQYTRSGTLYLQASSPGLTSACSTVTNVSAAAVSVADSSLTVSSATVASGSSIQVTLTAKDAFGNSNPSGISGIGVIQFLSTLVGGTGTFGSITHLGSQVFQGNFTAAAAGSVALSAKINGNNVTETQNVTVNPGAASQLVFSVQPTSPQTAGAVFSPAPEIQVKDAFGNTLTQLNSGTITLNPNSGTIAAGDQKSIVNGVALFDALEIELAGTNRTLTASDGTLTSAASNSFTVAPATATELRFANQPSTVAQFGRSFSIQPAVEVTDVFGNRHTTGAPSTTTIQIHAFSDNTCATPAGGTLGGTSSLAATSGLATFSNLSYSAPENLYIQAEGTGLNTACSTLIDVNQWRSLSTVSAPIARTQASSAWTGTHFVVWGGLDSSGNPLSNGGLYTPTTDLWTPINPTNAPTARVNPALASSGTQLFVWGGSDGSSRLNNGAMYNYATQSWTAIATLNAPSAREGMTLIWSGTEFYVFGGRDGATFYSDLYRFHPGTNSWTWISNNALSARSDAIGAWDSTTSKWVILGGADGMGDLNDGIVIDVGTEAVTAIAGEAGLGSVRRGTAVARFESPSLWVYGSSASFAYHSGTTLWTSISGVGEASRPRADFFATAFSSIGSSGFFVFGGNSGGSLLSSGATFETAALDWDPVPVETTSPTARMRGASEWTGEEILIWGGCTDGVGCAAPVNTGYGLKLVPE